MSNPTKVWDVRNWWLDGNRDFDRWTISKHWADVSPGDDVALWITGRQAGVYAVGRAASGAEPFEPDESDGYWIDIPDPANTRYVYLDVDQFLFDQPLYRADLLAAPAFQDAFIIRMPNGGNPSPLTDDEWRVIRRRARSVSATQSGQTGVSVLGRPIGKDIEEVLVRGSQGKVRQYHEAKLVRDYERWLGRPLRRHVLGLPTGERLVTDAFDARTRTLLEAKSNASRGSM